jgi:hypothetical protein
MIEIMATEADSILAITAHGTVSAEDYEKVIFPAIETKLKTHHKLRFLYHLGEDFKNYTPSAMWDDTKLGIRHMTSFEKIAVVSDVPWITQVATFFGHFVPCPVKLFRNDNLAEAKAWLIA